MLLQAVVNPGHLLLLQRIPNNVIFLFGEVHVPQINCQFNNPMVIFKWRHISQYDRLKLCRQMPR